MAVKVRHITQEKTFREIEIEYPIYRLHDCSGDTYESHIYTRIEESGRSVSISLTTHYDNDDVEWELEFETDVRHTEGDDYMFGLGKYALNQQTWIKIHNKFKVAVSEIGGL